MLDIPPGKQCPNCQYWLLPSNGAFRCSECGIEFDADAAIFVGSWDYGGRTRRFFMGMTIGLMTTAFVIGLQIVIRAMHANSPTLALLAATAIIIMLALSCGGLGRLRRRGAIVNRSGLVLFYPNQEYRRIPWSEVAEIEWSASPQIVNAVYTSSGLKISLRWTFAYLDVAREFGAAIREYTKFPGKRGYSETPSR